MSIIFIFHPFLVLPAQVMGAHQLQLPMCATTSDYLFFEVYISNEDGMARKSFQHALDELELVNFPYYQRWYASHRPLFYTLTDMHQQDFRNLGRFNRYDFCPNDYQRQPYWTAPGFVFPNYEPFCMLKRNDKRGIQGKGHYFNRDKRNSGERRFYPRRQEDSGNHRVNRKKTTDFPPQFERRLQPGWNRGHSSQRYHLPLENRNPSRLSFRSSLDLCEEDILIDQHLHNFKQMFENRNPSTDCLTLNENVTRNGSGGNGNGMHVDLAVDMNFCKSPDIVWKEHSDKTSSKLFTCSPPQYTTPSNFSSSYASWYCPEEQQQIVDVLKDVDLRHDRQLKRDVLLSRGEQPCSDDSPSNEFQNLGCIQKYSVSSEEDEDDINILLYPEVVPPILEAVIEEEELKSGYHETSASDFFEEFLNIFTGSPEKRILNNMTRESLKNPQNLYDGEDDAVERIITDDDKDAVKVFLNFQHLDELSEKAFGECSTIISSTPKEVCNEVASTQNTIPSSRNADVVSCKIAGASKVTESRQPHAVCSATSTHTVKGGSHDDGNVDDIRPMLPKKAIRNTGGITKSLCAVVSPKTPPTRELCDKHEYIQNSNESYDIPVINDFKTRYVSSKKGDCMRVKKNLNNIFNQLGKERKDKNYAKSHISPQNSIKVKGKTSMASLSSKNTKYEPKEKNRLSMSEPLLIPANEDVVYKRISVSEIFDSVRPYPVEDFKTLSNNKHHFGHFINQSMYRGDLSPSEHLKQILGIGKSAENGMSREMNPLKEHSLIENHFLGQSKPASGTTSTATREFQRGFQLLENKQEMLNEIQVRSESPSEDARFQNPSISRMKSVGKREECLVEPGHKNADHSCFENAVLKSEPHRDPKNENHDLITRCEPLKIQLTMKLVKQNRESTSASKYSGNNMEKQASKSECNSGSHHSEESGTCSSFQNGTSVNECRKGKNLSADGSNYWEPTRPLKTKTSHKCPDSRVSVNAEKTCGEPNESYLEPSKSKKKYKKKRKENQFVENDKRMKSKSVDYNDQTSYRESKQTVALKNCSDACNQNKNIFPLTKKEMKHNMSEDASNSRQANDSVSKNAVIELNSVRENVRYKLEKTQQRSSNPICDSISSVGNTNPKGSKFEGKKNSSQSDIIKSGSDTYNVNKYKSNFRCLKKECVDNRSKYSPSAKHANDYYLSNNEVAVNENVKQDWEKNQDQSFKPISSNKCAVGDSRAKFVKSEPTKSCRKSDIVKMNPYASNEYQNKNNFHAPKKEYMNRSKYLSNAKHANDCLSNCEAVKHENAKCNLVKTPEESSNLISNDKSSVDDSKARILKSGQTKYCKKTDVTKISPDTYNENKYKNTFQTSKTEYVGDRSKYASRVKRYNDFESNEVVEVNSIRGKVKHYSVKPQEQSSSIISNSKSSASNSNSRDLRFEEKPEVNNKERRDNSTRKFSAEKDHHYFTKYNYEKGYYYRGKTRYWKRSGYYDQYEFPEKLTVLNTTSSQGTQYDKEHRSCEYIKNASGVNDKEVPCESNRNFQDKAANMDCETNVQSVTTDNLAASTPHDEESSTRSGKKTSEIESSEAKIANGICRSSDSKYNNRKDKTSNSDIVSVFHYKVLKSIPMHSVSLNLLLEVRCETEQMLEKTKRLVYFVGKQNHDSLKEGQSNLTRQQQHSADGMFSSKRNGFIAIRGSSGVVIAQKPFLHSRNASDNRFRPPEKLFLCSLRKISNSNCPGIAKVQLLKSENCKENNNKCSNRNSTVSRLREFRVKSIFEHIFSNVPENVVFVVDPKVMESYFRNKQAMVLTPSLDVHVQVKLSDILCQCSSVRLSFGLQKSLHLSFGALIDGNLLQVLSLFLNFLSTLSTLRLPWSRNNLKELLDCSNHKEKENGTKLLKPRSETRESFIINDALKCWDILSSFFSEKEILGISNSVSRI